MTAADYKPTRHIAEQCPQTRYNGGVNGLYYKDHEEAIDLDCLNSTFAFEYICIIIIIIVFRQYFKPYEIIIIKNMYIYLQSSSTREFL